MRFADRMRFPVVICITLVVAVIACGGAFWMAVRDAKRDAAAQVATAFAIAGTAPQSPALSTLPSVASVKVYRTTGERIASHARGGDAPPLTTLAGRLAPREVRCETGPETTVCVETSPFALAERLETAFLLMGVTLLAALTIGALGGMWLDRRTDRRLAGMTDRVERAVRDRDYSLRLDASDAADAADGTLAALSSSVNDLLAQIQDREVMLRRRTIELEAANRELEAFAYSVSHDLRAPLGSIDGFVQALQLDYADQIDANGREYLGWIREGCRQMRDLIDGLLQMSRITRAELRRASVDLSAIARTVAEGLQQSDPARAVRFDIRDGVRAVGDERLLRAVVENLMNNAWKFTRHRDEACIEFGADAGAYFVRDNGAGFDPTHASKMFRPFQRLHASREFEGTGIGLATVQKIVERHGGRAWAEGEIEKGATIFFTTASEDLVHTT